MKQQCNEIFLLIFPRKTIRKDPILLENTLAGAGKK